MENASKALIIAGAILISLVLIGIGVLIVNGTRPITDEVGAQFSTQEKQAFNRQFETYEGNSEAAGNAKSLLSVVISSNATNKETGKTVTVTSTIVTLSKSSDAAKISELRSALNNSKKYKLELVYDDNGLVSEIKIAEK